MNRREFLFSAGAVTQLSGCRSFDLFGAPEMMFDYEIRAVPTDGSRILHGKPGLGRPNADL